MWTFQGQISISRHARDITIPLGASELVTPRSRLKDTSHISHQDIQRTIQKFVN